MGNTMSDMPELSQCLFTANLMPEILVGVSAFIFLLGGVYANNKRTDRLILGMGLFVLVSLLGFMLVLPSLHMQQLLFHDMFITDRFSFFVKAMLVASAALTFMLSAGWFNRAENQRFEFPVLMLFALLGMMLMVSAHDMLALYVGLELSSLPLYVLASFSRDSLKSTEAGLKYFVLGALASGLLLFGISLVYGFAGTTSFDALAHLFALSHAANNGVVVGLVLILTGFCFKVSAAPFHMWTPDVYEGAPTPVTAYFSTAPKIAAIALLVRLMVQPFGALIHDWQQVVIVVSVASMIAGAFGALTQNNIKRLLAYSSIGHVGYALMGLAAGTVDGISAILIYFTLYIFMSAGAFACVLMMSRDNEPVETIADLAGLSRSRPRLALAFAIFMFSMAGIPPLAGFFGKMYVFLAALNAGLTTVAVIGVLSSVVACFYYLKIVKLMYFDEPALPFDTEVTPATRWVLVLCSVVTMFFFIFPTPLVDSARIAAEALFK